MRRFALALAVTLLVMAPAAAAQAGDAPSATIGRPALHARLFATCTGSSGAPLAALLGATQSLRRGSTGGAVYELQGFLKLQGYSIGTVDGAFGSLTEAAVKAFQHDQGLSADGVAGSATRGAVRTLSQKAGFVSLASSSGKVLHAGDRGVEVTELQRWLKGAGNNPGTIDGVFGSATTAAVRAFQASKPGLTSDGKVGAATRVALAKALRLMWPGTCS
jgi:N-acetylmuramoyl-L-alanine amidase